ncbi:hypothetical protein DPMN_100517 [Dreissena polymorpha]|uniref:Uncharacterized protein n=1 Tax=Dreissena polymorpha TaxID=45954 RepID=A0A9D4LH71_DREPO|nr:hypothetical protein DPMN_100517 [Dreissena polymorpha]
MESYGTAIQQTVPNAVLLMSVLLDISEICVPLNVTALAERRAIQLLVNVKIKAVQTDGRVWHVISHVHTNSTVKIAAQRVIVMVIQTVINLLERVQECVRTDGLGTLAQQNVISKGLVKTVTEHVTAVDLKTVRKLKGNVQGYATLDGQARNVQNVYRARNRARKVLRETTNTICTPFLIRVKAHSHYDAGAPPGTTGINRGKPGLRRERSATTGTRINRDGTGNNRDGTVAPSGPIQTPAELWSPGESLPGYDADIAPLSAGGVTVYRGSAGTLTAFTGVQPGHYRRQPELCWDAAGFHRCSTGALPATTGALSGLHRDKP